MVLKQLHSVHSMACKERWYDNLAACVLGLKRKQARLTTEESAEEELVEALEQKYDRVIYQHAQNSIQKKTRPFMLIFHQI